MRTVLLLVCLLTLVASSAPAAITVEIKNGALLIKGDDAANAFTIDGTGLPADAIRVTPSGGTTVNGVAGPTTFTGYASGAKITLGDGADDVTITDKTLTGKLSIKTGKGSDRLTIDDATLAGPSTIDLGAGDDALSVCDAIFRTDVAVKLGKQTGAAVTTTCPNSGTLGTTGGSVAFVHHSLVQGALSVKGAAGLHFLAVDRTDVTGPLSTQNVAFVSACYGHVGNQVTVKLPKIVGNLGGAVSCQPDDPSGFNGFAGGNTAVLFTGMEILGGLTAKGNAGGDTVVLIGTNAGGEIKVDLGAAGGQPNSFIVNIGSSGSLVAKGGKNEDRLQVQNFVTVDDVTVKYGGGDNNVTFANSTIHGNLTIKTGAGADFIDTSANVTVDGVTGVDPGAGANTVH